VFVVLTAILLSPMRPGTHSESAQSEAVIDPGQVAVLPEDAPPAAPQEVSFTPRDPSQSLRAFLGEWEMNDFLFLIVVENLRPARDVAPEIRPWFSIVPDEWRSGLVALASPLLAVEEARIPFLLARIVTASCFILIAGWLAWQGATSRTAAGWLNAAFLTIAWFWLLLPTQNPWYWCWTLPFLPFARSRAWLAVSGLAFVYYFRFWLMRYFGDTAVAGTGYGGPLFFDYVIVWLEFGPWLAWLAAGTLWRRRLPS